MKKPILILVAAFVAVVGVMSFWLVSARKNAAADAARWKQAETELRDRLAAAERAKQNTPPAEPEETPTAPPSAATPHQPKVIVDDSTSRQALVQIIEEREKQLASVEGMLRDAQAKLQELNGRIEQLQDQQTKLQASESELRTRIDSMTQQASAQEVAMKARETRLAELEQSNSELRRKTDDSAKRLTRLQQLAENFDELARRREAYLNNIMGRYREATDLFRAMSVRLEQPRDTGVPVLGANDVSRIQNVISLAEEDMRQLRGLNTRAATLQKDLKDIGRR